MYFTGALKREGILLFNGGNPPEITWVLVVLLSDGAILYDFISL